MRYSVPRKSRRVPLETEVHLKLEEVPDPVTEITRNVSLGGMSVAIERPAAVGSLVAFELQIGDALVEGTGEVVWSREGEETSNRPAGMGIRFRYLSPGSRERIFRLVQWYANQEGEVTAADVAAAAAGGLPSPSSRRVAGEAPVPTLASEDATTPAGEVGEEEYLEMPAAPGTGLGSGTEEPVQGFDLPASAEPTEAGAGAGAEGEGPWSWLDRPSPTPPPEVSSPPESPRWEAPTWEERGGGGMELPEAPSEPVVPPGELSAGPAAAYRPAHLRGTAYSRSASRGELLRRWLLLLVVIAALIAALLLLQKPVLRWLESGGETEPAATSDEAAVPEEAPAAESGAQEATAREERASSPPPVEVVEPGEEEIRAETGEEESGGEPPEAPAEPRAAAGTPPAGEPSPQADRPEPAPATPPPTAPAGASPLRAVEEISWQRSDEGTVVTIEGDGALSARRYSSVRLGGGRPRLLIRIRGVEKPYPRPAVGVGSPELEGIRSGLHLQPGGTELHVVLDLASSYVVAESIEETGRGLRILLRRSPPSG